MIGGDHPTKEGTPMGSPSALMRVKRWLAQRLGHHYAATISIADRTLCAFAGTFLTKMLASGLGTLTNVSYLSAAAGAGILAALAVVQGVLTTAVTGNPTAASFVSSTMRARRDNGERVRHWVPVRKGRWSARPNA